MKRKIGRKFIAAAFAAGMAVVGFVKFCALIDKPNAPLIMTAVVVPCLGIVWTVLVAEGAKDFKVAKNGGGDA